MTTRTCPVATSPEFPARLSVTRSLTNNAYEYPVAPATRTYAVNGRNQYTQVGGTTHSWDANGNLTGDGATTFGYDTENRLTSASGAKNASLAYDPLGRLYQVTSGSNTTRFVYDGDRLIAEYNGSGTLLRRYVHGAGIDEPLIWYEGAAVSSASRRYLHANHQGSIVATSNAAGAKLAIHAYDPYGVTAASNTGRFQYTGQASIPELGLLYYKARFYNPGLGRFMQTDSIGYDDDFNLYAYVGNDPINAKDSTGKCRNSHDCHDPDKMQDKKFSQPQSDGSRSVVRQSVRKGENGTYRVEKRGEIALLPQDTADGAPAPVTAEMEDKLLSLSDSIDDKTVEVTSGYRSQEAQDRLRQEGNPRAVAVSPHTVNQAADIRVDGMTPDALADAAAATGEFARSNSYSNGGDVHVDQNTAARHQGRVCDYRPCN